MNTAILIVEDSAEVADILKNICESQGFEATVVESGEEALEKIIKRKFDLMILDIMLPRLDGFEVARRVKASPQAKALPIIALTAFDVPDIFDRCKLAGIDEVILKPFNHQDILAKIKKHLPDG